MSPLGRPVAASWATRRSLGVSESKAGQDDSPGPPAGGDELGSGLFCERARSAAVGEVERVAEDLTALRPVSGAPESRTQVRHGAVVL
jgi:hypothetical protein